MRPQNIRAQITRIKEQILVEKILIKTHERYRDLKNYNERVAKQKAIITEAEKAIAVIRHERKAASGEIAKIRRHMRFENKRLIVLNNYEKIEKFKKMMTELKTIQKSKEIDDGEEYNNTQA